MKFQAISAAAATAALSLALTGTAAASPAQHQPDGRQLESELLAPSYFGPGFYKSNPFYTPNGWRSRHARSVSAVSCADAEEQPPDYDFGQTASAGALAVNPTPWTTGNPPTQPGPPAYVNFAYQGVMQFGGSQQATSFYNQLLSEYQQCQGFDEPVPNESGDIQVATQDITQTQLYTCASTEFNAFYVTQVEDYSAAPSASAYLNSLVVNNGDYVYTVFDNDTTNDQIDQTLLFELMKRVQDTYFPYFPYC